MLWLNNYIWFNKYRYIIHIIIWIIAVRRHFMSRDNIYDAWEIQVSNIILFILWFCLKYIYIYMIGTKILRVNAHWRLDNGWYIFLLFCLIKLILHIFSEVYVNALLIKLIICNFLGQMLTITPTFKAYFEN